MTPSEIAFNEGRQDWFICSLGYRHTLLDEQLMTFSISCPDCADSFQTDDPVVAAEWEAGHEISHRRLAHERSKIN